MTYLFGAWPLPALILFVYHYKELIRDIPFDKSFENMKKQTILRPLIKGSIFAAIVGGVFALLGILTTEKQPEENGRKEEE
jgi:hypothetical protein